MLILLYFLFVLCPIIFWFSFFYWEDRADPGPKKLMAFIFLLGIGMAILAGAFNSLISYYLLPDHTKGLMDFIKHPVPMFFVVLAIGSVLEESLKYLTLREFFYDRVQFNQIADGIFYGVTLALGFSLVENTSYFFMIHQSMPYVKFLIDIAGRAVFSVTLHITTAGILGFYLGKRKYSLQHSRKYLFLSLAIAYSLHLSFNLLSIVGFIAVIPALTFLIVQLKNPDVLAVWRLVEVDAGGHVIRVD